MGIPQRVEQGHGEKSPLERQTKFNRNKSMKVVTKHRKLHLYDYVENWLSSSGKDCTGRCSCLRIHTLDVSEERDDGRLNGAINYVIN